MNRNTTTITLSNENGDYMISNNAICMSVDDIRDCLLEPLLLAAGYAPENIKDLFDMAYVPPYKRKKDE